MPQININVTAEFEAALRKLMRARGIRSKSEAIRVAVQESAERIDEGATDFSQWLGAATHAPENPNPKFPTDDDLWS